jgi:hypothetical protein
MTLRDCVTLLPTILFILRLVPTNLRGMLCRRASADRRITKHAAAGEMGHNGGASEAAVSTTGCY